MRISAMRPVSAEEIESLAIGAWILGTGGGGSPYLALLNMRQLYRAGRGVPAHGRRPSSPTTTWWRSSPTWARRSSGQERLTDPKTMALAVTMMEEYLGRKFRAVMSLEIGGGNSIQPFMAAAMLDLPVVDGDCMGRAFPEAQMTSFAIHDLQMYPLDPRRRARQRVVVARAASWKWMERISRKACVEVGSIASTCKAPRTGKEIKECAILGSTTKAIGIGRAVQAARRAHRDPDRGRARGRRRDQALQRQDPRHRAPRHRGLPPRHRHASRAWTTSGATRFSLAFQNEFAVGWLDGEPRVMTPDLICVLDTVSGDAIGTETLRYGQRVTVIALPAPPILLTPEGARARGPARLRLRPRLPLGVRVRRRIGIDVGGTNTDAVLLEDGAVAAAVKTPTTADVTTGITARPRRPGGAGAGCARRATRR